MTLLVQMLLVTSGAALVAATSYAEYFPGTLDLILTAPHGGTSRPKSIPDRRNGCINSRGSCYYGSSCTHPTSRCEVSLKNDLNTKELAVLLREKLHGLLGGYPHLVTNKLHRKKLDANRDIREGAQGSSTAERAWREFHDYVGVARRAVSGRGLLLDIHGHAHNVNWAEMGYLVSKSSLNGVGGRRPQAGQSSIKSAASNHRPGFESILRGDASLGKYLSDAGYYAVPSPRYPSPGSNTYFNGGYITRTYGSRDSGSIDAIQIESSKWNRATASLETYSTALAQAIARYWRQHY